MHHLHGGDAVSSLEAWWFKKWLCSWHSLSTTLIASWILLSLQSLQGQAVKVHLLQHFRAAMLKKKKKKVQAKAT
ncbi:hypothetical protein MTO96_016719 [Rhipicephalus appendiculatus]